MSEPSPPIQVGGTPVTFGPVLLPPDPPEAVAALERALTAAEPERHPALRTAAARWPNSLAAWAWLGDSALARGDTVEAYAFYRTAYHRGLDRLRGNGWRGAGRVPWSHVPNQGFLRAVHGLGAASALVGESGEAERCRAFLHELDPTLPADALPRHP